MSTGEKAKPPATFEERNPFDISRRSGPEVAAEIAKRMAAWKQARARTSPGATPASTAPSTSSPSGNEKMPPIAAPVQPARMPARGAQAAQAPAATASAGSAASRVPYFAVSATRRAMPPAPSLKKGSARPPATETELPASVSEPATVAIVREDHEAQPLPAAETISATTPGLPAAAPTEPVLEQDAAVASTSGSGAHPFDSSVAAEASDPAPVALKPAPAALESAPEASEPAPAEPDERERRRVEARAIKARWIAARDLDALLEQPVADTAPVATAVEAVAPRESRPPASGEAASAPDAVLEPAPQPVEPQTPVAATPEAPVMDEQVPAAADSPVEEAEDSVEAWDEPVAIEASDSPAHDAVEDQHALSLAALDAAVGRKEPTFDAPVVPVASDRPALDAPRDLSAAPVPPLPAHDDTADELPALSIAALDAAAGRKEPTFDAPALPVASDRPALDAPRVRDVASAPMLSAHDEAADELPALSIATLDAAAGRKEPTFDEPAGRIAEAQEEAPSAPIPAPVPILSARDQAVDDVPETVGRKEPTLDSPVQPAVSSPAAVSAHKAQIKLRPIETRIEARRVETLRADPQLAVHRPIFPHIEPEEWDVPPAVAARANVERRGTGWAIGLGSLLLIAGITAPAAIWQQGRQEQDQAMSMAPAPAMQQTAAAPGPSGAPVSGTTTAQTSVEAQATLPAAPEPETPPSSAATAQQSGAPGAAESQATTKQAASNAVPTTTLSAIGQGESVNEAPIVAPQPPTVNLASKSVAGDANAPMVARPFVPADGEGHFLQAPTAGSTSVPVAGGDARPTLIGQLKPKATGVASASKPVVAKPRPVQRQAKPFFQQSPDQMFNTLIETLSEGRPVNPNTKPTSPSSRR